MQYHSGFLQQNDMDVRPCPALSPCLHLIEHLCSDIQRLIEFQPMPTTTAELGATLFMVWVVLHLSTTSFIQ
jgi:hypothetical protein